jgi:hypothetical protein
MNKQDFLKLMSQTSIPSLGAAPGQFGGTVVPTAHLRGAILSGTAAAGDILDGDVSDAASATPRIRAASPWRGLVQAARVLLLDAETGADIAALCQSVALRFALQTGTYDILLADLYSQQTTGDTTTAVQAGDVDLSYRPLPVRGISLVGSASDRVQLVCLYGDTLPAASLTVSLAGLFADPGASDQATVMHGCPGK